MVAIRRCILMCIAALLSFSLQAKEQHYSLTEQEYFAKSGVNVLVFSNWYNGLFSDSKMSGVEFIHHGERSVTNGDVRVNATPEQWDLIPEFVERKVDREKGRIEAVLRYPSYNFEYSVVVTSQGSTLQLEVILPANLPPALEGKAGFNLEFLPSTYFEKAFLMDGHPGIFPLYPTGRKEQNDSVAPAALASGKTLVLAPEDSWRRVKVQSQSGELALYDGRGKAQNGWFVLRELLPSGKSGRVLHWDLDISGLAGWTREPNITYSQLGYHPQQEKVAIVELDQEDRSASRMTLYRVMNDGTFKVQKRGKTEFWGQYQRYHYRRFNFSEVVEAGVYVLEYGKQRSAAFRIASDIYHSAWYPTLDVYLPVQMDHVLVNEAYRVWHGASHLDDAVQAPINHEHFDLYAQGPSTDTKYKPGQHIPGLNIGGWYDAGDYDIRTQTQYNTVQNLVNTWESFALRRDTTLVDYSRKYVDLHVPDGKPDLLQQIEHGTLGLIAQHRALGRAIPGIIVPDISQYTHLGDGLTMTDNLIYEPSMKPEQSDGVKSGLADDRWAFTSRSSALNYGSIGALAAASRALAGYNDTLAKECLQTALKAWDEEQSHEPYVFTYGNTTGGPLASEMLKAAVELLISTGDKRFQPFVLNGLEQTQAAFAWNAIPILRAIPFMEESFKQEVRLAVLKHLEAMREFENGNPFGVMITDGGWAGNGAIIHLGMVNYFLHKEFPDLVGREKVFGALNYIYGTHPDHNLSFVSNVGTQSKRVAYGMNRADYSFLPGGIVPGVLLLKPDYPENKEDWPFLWGENEYVVNLGASYIFLVNAADELLKE